MKIITETLMKSKTSVMTLWVIAFAWALTFIIGVKRRSVSHLWILKCNIFKRWHCKLNQYFNTSWWLTRLLWRELNIINCQIPRLPYHRDSTPPTLPRDCRQTMTLLNIHASTISVIFSMLIFLTKPSNVLTSLQRELPALNTTWWGRCDTTKYNPM